MDGLRTRREFLRLAAGAAPPPWPACRPGVGNRSRPSRRGRRERPRAENRRRDGRCGSPSGATSSPPTTVVRRRVHPPLGRGARRLASSSTTSRSPSCGTRAAAEVAARRGHDLFAFITPPPASRTRSSTTGRSSRRSQAKLGKHGADRRAQRSQPEDRARYFGFPDYWVANPVHYRADLWNQVSAGPRPRTWDDVLLAAPGAQGPGAPSRDRLSPDDDSELLASSPSCTPTAPHMQDETGTLTINRPATVEAVKLGPRSYRAGMTEDVFAWDGIVQQPAPGLGGRASLDPQRHLGHPSSREQDRTWPPRSRSLRPRRPGRRAERRVNIVGVHTSSGGSPRTRSWPSSSSSISP